MTLAGGTLQPFNSTYAFTLDNSAWTLHNHTCVYSYYTVNLMLRNHFYTGRLNMHAAKVQFYFSGMLLR
jgi:hypothetical protein